MSVAVFLRVQLCLLIPVVLCFPVIPESSKPVGLGTSNEGDRVSSVDTQNWILWNSNSELGANSLSRSSTQLSSADSEQAPIPSEDSAKSHSSIISGDTHINVAHFSHGEAVTEQKHSQNNHKTSDDVFKVFPTLTTNTKPSKKRLPVIQYQLDRSKLSQPNIKRDKNRHLPKTDHLEYAIPANHVQSLQLAVVNDNNGEGQKGVSQLVIAVATSLATLFSLGLVIGVFGCCCKKQLQADENENKNAKAVEEGDKKTSQIINPSDIPSGEKDLDDPVFSIKDKIRALDGKLDLLSPSSPQDNAAKRKSQTPDVVNLGGDKAFYSNNVNPPKMLVSEEDVTMRDKSKTKSLGDNISKSDTQDDISDKIFDNISTHSSISQPHNPDVVIADTDDEGDEFAQLQRGTVILKSFQRAKPPRNRSPATRTSKGKIRKARPHLDRSTEQDKSKSREASGDREHASTASSLSLTPSQGTSSKTNSLDNKSPKPAKRTSLDKQETNVGGANKLDSPMGGAKKLDSPMGGANKLDSPMGGANKLDSPMGGAKLLDSPMTKSSDFSDFDSIMSQSVTSISSDVGNGRKHDSPISARYKKIKDSPKSDRVGRTDSPVRALKSAEREVTDREPRVDSPNMYRKSKDSPKAKRHRRHERDARDLELRNGKSEGNSESTMESVAETNSAPKRLSGIPASANNNIFYLIDPTVKNKCKSVGDVTKDKRKSGDYSSRKSGDYSSRKSGDFSRVEARAAKHKVGTPDSIDDKEGIESVSPTKRERTLSDPSRNSREVQDTPL